METVAREHLRKIAKWVSPDLLSEAQIQRAQRLAAGERLTGVSSSSTTFVPKNGREQRRAEQAWTKQWAKIGNAVEPRPKRSGWPTVPRSGPRRRR